MDFILERDAKVLPIEVKSGKHYKRHRALTHLLNDAEYDFPQAIVFDDDALKVEGKIRYMPIYMAMFLQKDVLPEKMIYDIGAPVT